jgi:simple sugar transport system ATP-binding protein
MTFSGPLPQEERIATSPPLIEFRNISKKFGEIYANRDISFDVRSGEIHAVAGENGAGKTTLMNVLFGRLQPDSGSLVLRGKQVSFGSPREAVRAGIGMVHQDILIFPQLSVLENIIIGSEPVWPAGAGVAGALRTGPARKAISRIQQSSGFRLEIDRQTGELTFALRQQVELVRMLYRGAEILILDEPTSLLSPGETEKFLDLVKSIRAGGRTVLFISHRLVEIFSIADRITVLRGGSLAATLDAGDTDAEEIARLMVGGVDDATRGTETDRLTGKAVKCEERQFFHREFVSRRPGVGMPDESHGPGEGHFPGRQRPVLELRNVSAAPTGTEPALRDISISIGKGEIFGLGGVVGNGQRSLAGLLAGKSRPDSGSILFDGEEISGVDIGGRLKRNIWWLQENPMEEALLPERSLWENFLLGRQRSRDFARAGFIRRREIAHFSQKQIELNDISATGPAGRLSSLSGGNRQKVALARVLASSPSLAILEQPCRGLGFRAADALFDRLLELSLESGSSFILISYNFDELLSICKRIAVIYRGEIIGMAESANLTREILGGWAAGVKN